MDMKIIVTGGCGFIGSNLVRLLVEEKGQSVINLDKLTYAGNAESLADLDGNPNYTFEQVDLCNAAALRAIFSKHQPDAVMHLAAESHVDRSIDGPGEFIQTNIVGTYNLLQASLEYWRSLPEAEDVRVESSSAELLERKTSNSNNMKKSNFRFLHVSTDEVYGSLAPDASGFSETTPYDPHSPYSGVISIFAERLRAGEGLTLHGDGGQTRDFIYVGDVVRHLLAGMMQASVEAPVFNACTGRQTSIKSLAETMADVLEMPLGIGYGPARPGDIRDSLGDPSRAISALGVKAETDLATGLKLLFQVNG